MPRTIEPAVIDGIVLRIVAGTKYRALDAALVRRVAGEAAERFHDRNQAVKYAKRKLHQAFGAFLRGSPAQAVAELVAAIEAGRADKHTALLAAMRSHASSAERAGWLAPLYAQVGAWCGAAGSVVDLACGLNPLAIPWMRLAPDASYWACEIDGDLVANLAGLDRILPVRLSVRTADLVASPRVPSADVALLLKVVTTLDQQRSGAAARVLGALDCRHVILSLPRCSLSGGRQYADDPESRLAVLMAGAPYRLDGVAAFGDEQLYHLVRRQR